jgi:hypothetical protein
MSAMIKERQKETKGERVLFDGRLQALDVVVGLLKKGLVLLLLLTEMPARPSVSIENKKTQGLAPILYDEEERRTG